MPRPLRVVYDANENFSRLQEMSDTEQEYLVELLCTKLANDYFGDGTALITINDAQGGDTFGTFVDNYRPNLVGSHPVSTTINSTTYTFRQKMQYVSGNDVRPVRYTSGGVRASTPSADLYPIYLLMNQHIGNQGVGAYRLQLKGAALPTSDGRTWVQVGPDIVDTLRSGNTTYALYHCIGQTTPTEHRPLKIDTDSDPVALKEMTDDEIATLLYYYTYYITRVAFTFGPKKYGGQYIMTASLPSNITGTWVQMGDTISDKYNAVENVAYTGTYTNTFSGTYSGTVNKTFSGNYAGTYSKYEAEVRNLYYAGKLAAQYVGYYLHSYTGTYAGSRVKSYTGSYSGSRSYDYTGSYTGLTVVDTVTDGSKAKLYFRTK